ncbi:MAG TPA: ABC transporter permease [Gemmatimonadaceae bacterium]|nr:ABC transporter permease [Gemmatimonadaceae bacterium]
MPTLRAISRGLRALFHRDETNRELDDELAHYIELSAAEKERAGMSRAAALHAARAEVGSAESVKEEVRSGGWESRVDTVRRDIVLAVRSLRRTPTFTAIALLTLALGVGANTTMFSVVNAVMLRPLPYRAPNDLVLVWTNDVQRGLPREATARSTILDWRERTRTLSDVAYFTTQRAAALGNDPSSPRERTRSALSSGNLFAVLGADPVKGRVITAEDESARANVAVISYAFWQRHFSGAPDVLGKTLHLDDDARGGQPLTVIGVMPRDFYFPDKLTDVWMPATTYWRFDRESSERFPSWARRWTAVARLARGRTVHDASTELAGIGKGLATQYVSTVPDFPGFAASVVPVLDFVTGPGLQSSLWILFAAVTMVLLIACANVANLLIARSATRQREFVLRRALGADRARIVGQLVVESLTLAVTGSAIGLFIATWSTKLLAGVIANYVPRADEITVDARVLVFTAATAIAVGLIFGILPALQSSTADASDALREGARATGAVHTRRLRSALVLAECAIAMVLLAGAGLLMKSLDRLRAVDPGFAPRGVLTVRLEFPAEPPPTAAELTQTSATAQARARARTERAEQVLASVASLAGVSAAGYSDDLFVNGQGNESITIPGRDESTIPAGELNEAAASADFFTLMHVRLRAGRYPTRDDAAQKIRALWTGVITDMPLAEKERHAVFEPVVVNEAFARRYFPNESAVGKRFCIDPTNKTYWYEIVGVVGDMHRQGLEKAPIPEYYGPYIPSAPGRADLLVRTSVDPASLAAAITERVNKAWPGVTVVSALPAEALLGGFSAQRALQAWLLAAFALLAVLLAAVGIFGLVQYAVSERTREIGVRVALGASPGEVMSLVIRDGMKMPALGLAVGVAAAFIGTRALGRFLFNVTPTDPVTFIAVALGLLIVAAVACYVPGRWAAKTDPMTALRK